MLAHGQSLPLDSLSAKHFRCAWVDVQSAWPVLTDEYSHATGMLRVGGLVRVWPAQSRLPAPNKKAQTSWAFLFGAGQGTLTPGLVLGKDAL